MEYQQNFTGLGYRRASYAFCSKIVNDCLLRMKQRNKVISGKEERTVVRLFGLETSGSLHQRKVTLPAPSPAPDGNTLWLVLNRPDYYFFHFNGDLGELCGCKPNKVIITHSLFEKSLHFILKDEYRRERILAMLEHMAITNGGSLSTCSKVNILNHIYIDDFSTYLITLTCFYQSYKCESVSYCCREHQLFHWKKGGHKQQCSL